MTVNMKILMMEHLCCGVFLVGFLIQKIEKWLLLYIDIGCFSTVTPSLRCSTLRFVLTVGYCDPHLKFLLGALGKPGVGLAWGVD